MSILGTFFSSNLFALNDFFRKTRKILQNKIKQESVKKTKTDLRSLKQKIFCTGW